MRKLVAFFDIIIFGLALTVFTLIMIMSKSILSSKYLNNVIKDEGIYKTINDNVKDKIKGNIGSQIINYPGVTINTNELIDSVLTEEVLEKEFKYVVDNLYSTGKLVVDPNILSEGYKKNFENYVASKKINMPEQLKNEITSSMVDNSQEKIEVKEFNDNFSDYFIKLRDYVSIIKIISLSIIAALLGLTLLVSKERIKLIYKPLILAAINLFGIGALTKLLYSLISSTDFPSELFSIITSIKNHLFNEFVKYGIVFVVIAIILIIVRIVLKKKKQNVNDNQNIVNNQIQPAQIQNNQQQIPVQSTIDEQPVQNAQEQSIAQSHQSVVQTVQEQQTNNM